MSEFFDPVSASPRFRLPYLFVGQAQKEYTVNQAIALTDALLQPVVHGQADAPPPGAAEGDAWIVGPSPEGSWSDQAGALAVLTENEWRFVNPVERMQIFDSTAGSIAVWRDGAWWWPQAVTSPTGGGTIDAEARAALGALLGELRAAGILPT